MTERPGRLSGARYLVGLVVTVAAIVSQYFVPQLVPATRAAYASLVGDLLIVYGIPIVVLAALLGAGPLRGWRQGMREATFRGLGWYGALSLLGLGVAFALVVGYEIVDPSALHLLGRQNPELRAAAGDPWLYVGISFVAGACEEVIFRGWLFGAWLARGASWLRPAVGTSALFAGVHLYYGLTYGAASPILYQELFLTGLAFAATYHLSGGNLLVPAALHGAHDALAFLFLVAPGADLAVSYGFVIVAALVGLAYRSVTHRGSVPRVEA